MKAPFPLFEVLNLSAEEAHGNLHREEFADLQ